MKCIYQEFMRRKKENWRVEFTEDMRIRFIESGMLTSEETRLLREIIAEHKNRGKKKETIRLQDRGKSFETSDYSTSDEFQKLFEKIEESTTDDEKEDNECMEPPYKPLPDVLQDLIEVKCAASSDEDGNEVLLRGRKSENRTERYRIMRKLNVTSETEDGVKNSKGICQSYRPKRYPVRSRDRRTRKRIVFESSAPMNRDASETNLERCCERRSIMDKFQLKGLDDQSQKLPQFQTKNGISFDNVVCCILCRLLILTNEREEHYIHPCKCLDVFVHTECTLSYKTELVRQKCSNCNQSYCTRKTYERSETKFDEHNEATNRKKNSKKEGWARRRLPVEYETDCFICFGSRKIRNDPYEKLDSTIVRACRCNVTAHNECLVKLLLSKRACEYCGQRLQMKAVGPNLGYFHKKIAFIYGSQVVFVICMGIVVILLTSQYFGIPNTAFNMIVRSICISSTIVASAYLILSILSVWKKNNREIDRKSSVWVRPYELLGREVNLSNAMKQTVRLYYEEVPFEKMKFHTEGIFEVLFDRN